MTRVASGYRCRERQEWVDVFVQESLRDELRKLASRYSRLRAATVDYLESRGRESEPQYLTRLRSEVGREEANG